MAQLVPPQLTFCVHSLPVPPEQSMTHDDALVQSSVPVHDEDPQSISHGTPVGHVMGALHAPAAVQS